MLIFKRNNERNEEILKVISEISPSGTITNSTKGINTRLAGTENTGRYPKVLMISGRVIIVEAILVLNAVLIFPKPVLISTG